MSPIDWSRPRHFTQITPAAVSWKCPSCQTVNTTRFEDGCPACGAGTVAMNEAAQVRAGEPINLATLVLGEAMAGMSDKVIAAFVEGKQYTSGARASLAAALAFAADNGMPPPKDGLNQQAMLAWARVISGTDE